MGSFETTSLGLATIVVGWIFIILALLTTILQLWSHYIHRKHQEFYDHLLHIAFALSFAMMILTTWAVITQGQGRHMSSESHSQFQNAAKSLFINDILWGIVNTFMRLGTIGYLHRIFVVHSPFWSTPMAVLCSISSIAYGVAVIVTPLVICMPIPASWDNTIPGRCGNQKAAFLGLEISGLIIDLIITFWPIPTIFHLQISPEKKLWLFFVFSLGSLVSIITGLRIAALDKVNSPDFTYDEGYIGLLSIAGPLIAVICCSASVVPGLIHQARESSRKPSLAHRSLHLNEVDREFMKIIMEPNLTLPSIQTLEMVDLESGKSLPSTPSLASLEQGSHQRDIR